MALSFQSFGDVPRIADEVVPERRYWRFFAPVQSFAGTGPTERRLGSSLRFRAPFIRYARHVAETLEAEGPSGNSVQTSRICTSIRWTTAESGADQQTAGRS